MKRVRVIVCGIDGYGSEYLEPLLESGAEKGADLVGAIEPSVSPSAGKDLVRGANVPIFRSLSDFFAQGRCDLAVLCTPIQFHCSQTLLALENGSHVLCEKPLCVTEEEICSMQQAEANAGKTVTVGYQWSHSPAIQRLKADIHAGRFGRPLRFRTLVLWPRDWAYYRRNNWAGSLRDPNGRCVLDSPASNAMAHFLHNMFYVLGSEPATSAMPVSAEAVRCRAYPITNYDTVAMRVTSSAGVPLYFYASHTSEENLGPVFSYEFEKGTVTYDDADGCLQGNLASGERIEYGTPNENQFAKLWAAVSSARTGQPPLCGIAASQAHTRCIAMVQDDPRGIVTMPESRVRRVENRRYVEGLQEALISAFEQGTLPSPFLKEAAQGSELCV